MSLCRNSNWAVIFCHKMCICKCCRGQERKERRVHLGAVNVHVDVHVHVDSDYYSEAAEPRLVAVIQVTLEVGNFSRLKLHTDAYAIHFTLAIRLFGSCIHLSCLSLALFAPQCLCDPNWPWTIACISPFLFSSILLFFLARVSLLLSFPFCFCHFPSPRISQVSYRID